MHRILRLAFLLCAGIGISAFAVDQDQTKVVKINDSIYMVPTSGNVYMVTTPAGNVIIDTAASDLAAEAKALLAAESHEPVSSRTC